AIRYSQLSKRSVDLQRFRKQNSAGRIPVPLLLLMQQHLESGHQFLFAAVQAWFAYEIEAPRSVGSQTGSLFPQGPPEGHRVRTPQGQENNGCTCSGQ